MTKLTEDLYIFMTIIFKHLILGNHLINQSQRSSMDKPRIISRFGFEGWIWVLIASVPDPCILFENVNRQRYICFWTYFDILIHFLTPLIFSELKTQFPIGLAALFAIKPSTRGIVEIKTSLTHTYQRNMY